MITLPLWLFVTICVLAAVALIGVLYLIYTLTQIFRF